MHYRLYSWYSTLLSTWRTTQSPNCTPIHTLHIAQVTPPLPGCFNLANFFLMVFVAMQGTTDTIRVEWCLPLCSGGIITAASVWSSSQGWVYSYHRYIYMYLHVVWVHVLTCSMGCDMSSCTYAVQAIVYTTLPYRYVYIHSLQKFTLQWAQSIHTYCVRDLPFVGSNEMACW